MSTVQDRQITVRTTRFDLASQAEAFAFFVAFVKKYGEVNAFLLDSITDSQTKYCSSIVGLFPLLSVRGKGNRMTISGEEAVLSACAMPCEVWIERNLPSHLDRVMQQFAFDPKLPPYAFGYLGFFCYDCIRYFECIPKTTVDDRQIDDFHLQIHRIVLHITPDETVVFVHDIPGVNGPGLEEIRSLLAEAASGSPEFAGYDRTALAMTEDVSFGEYVDRVARAKEYIQAGDIFQCQVSKRIRITGEIDSLMVYGQLRQMNPSPYMFYARYEDYLVFGASPEMQVRVENRFAQMKPIAGTSKGKGKTPEENQRLIELLVNDPKERAEHVMLVDLCRNDLGRVAEQGTVKVEELLKIEEYSHVFHLVSLVTATVREGVSPFDVFLSTFPAGTLTGAPKVRAMEIIDELEEFDRGPYGGVIGMIDCHGNLDTAIVIRTVVHKDGVTYLQAAAGVVADSIPEQEWNECNHKLGALRATIS